MLVFDTLLYAKKLQSGGFTPQQAETQAEALKEIVENDLATKRDLKELEASLKRDIKESENNLRREMAEIKTEMIKWMFGMSFAQISIIVALIKLIP